MKNRYEKIMERVEVSTEMHNRIMNNLNNMDFSKKKTKVFFIRNSRIFVPVAACFMLLIIGVFTSYQMTSLTRKTPTQVVPDIMNCNSVSDLSENVEFNVQEVQYIPFDTLQTQYVSYWKKVAEIVYEGTDNTLVFRMSVGSEDNSGDFNEYGDVKSISVGDYSITIKGDNGQYKLAIWEFNGYSYSVNITRGISEEKMLEVVKAVN